MNSGLITVHPNNPENLIDDPESFGQHCSWLIIRHNVKTIPPTTTQSFNTQLDGRSNPHVFTYIKKFTYIIPVNYNVQIINVRKYPATFSGLVITKFQKQTLLYHSGNNITCQKYTHTHNISNYTQKLQSVQKCTNWGS